MIGVFGVPGCGKSHAIRKIDDSSRNRRRTAHGLYPRSYELSDEITGSYQRSQANYQDIVGQERPRVKKFEDLDDEEKQRERETTIRSLQTKCSGSRIAGVIASQYAFWPEKNPTPQRLMTDAETEVYTHVVYLNTTHRLLQQYRDAKHTNTRAFVKPSVVPEDHLRKWQELEISELRAICYRAGILFSVISGNHEQSLTTRFISFATSSPDAVIREGYWNRLHDLLPSPLDGIRQVPLETALVFDGDRTISPEDSSRLFWDLASETDPNVDKEALKTLFDSDLRYSDRALM
ncbi:hypothetical protein IMZ48_30605 [Candidatus Bathyarchaeota archaeon]|nr:hypothetical protein [Candidatus Bathyarchaeota archaeon]